MHTLIYQVMYGLKSVFSFILTNMLA